MVSIHLFALGGLSMAALAGRVGEDGTGAMWIAPELVAATTPAIAYCSVDTRRDAPELRFELIEPAALHAHPSQSVSQLLDDWRQVGFDWNPATGELSYRAISGSRVFSDLSLSGLEFAPARCGAR